jgi:NAD(P)-dependent dehydrogenase (short-subunit alcohol dehydrogenase family)
MRVLITGGSGFIGSALVRRLVLEDGWDVVNLDALTYAAAPASLADLDGRDNYAFIHADIRDRAAVDAALKRHEPDAVMHLAAESHVDRSITSAGAFVDTNVMGTFTVLEAARAYRDARGGGGAMRFGCCISPPTKSSARSAMKGGFPRRRPMIPPRPILRPRPRPITWCAPGGAPTGSMCGFRTARTITGRGNSRKS